MTGSQITKYYYAGSQRVAMRKYIVPQNPTLNYLLGDHLGSTSITTDANGQNPIETRYKPWGEVRYTTPNQTLPTRYTYTGQYSYINDDATDLGSSNSFGLMFYNARWYDPALGRFAQADTIIPGGVQGYDRYAYVNNSPLNFTDPSGHKTCTDDGYCGKLNDYSYQRYMFWQRGKDAGYSDWETKVLFQLYEHGGPNAVHGVDYILEKNIHIEVGTGWQAMGGATGAWFNNNTITLNSDVEAGSVDANGNPTLWGLSLVIHEARHIEQGSELSHSKVGEMEGWQIQFDVLQNLGAPLSDVEKEIKDAPTVEEFSRLIEKNWPEYWKRPGLGIGLYTYPDYPDVCLSLDCSHIFIKPWWLNTNFP